jgi:hypothetical protein
VTGNAYRLELARRITAAERDHAAKAEQMWRVLDVTAAVHHRGLAEGLAAARDLMLEIAADEGEGNPTEPAPADGAMHSVWLHGKWRWLTSKMTTEQREAAADAVQRYSDWLGQQDDELPGEVLDLRWWRDV